MRTLGILALGFSSVSTFDATEMRRRFHAFHSKPEFFRCNSHCFVTRAPLDLAMHYPWCYIATRKILISNKHMSWQTWACKFSVHKFQVALRHAHAVSQNICEPNMHVSGPIHRENGYREIWGNIISKNNRYEWGLEPQFTLSFTHDLRNLIIQQDFGLERLFWSLLVYAFIWMSCMRHAAEDMDPC